MINAQTAQMRPNLLAMSVEEEEEQRRQHSRVFRDTSNQRQRHHRKRPSYTMQTYQTPESPLKLAIDPPTAPQPNVNQNVQSPLKPNLLVQFDSEDEDQVEDKENPGPETQRNEEQNGQFQEDNLTLPRRKSFLLAFESEEDLEADKTTQRLTKQPMEIDRQDTAYTSQRLSKQRPNNIKPQFLLDFEGQNSQQDEDPQQSINSKECEDNQSPTLRKITASLHSLIKEFKDSYYLAPIPHGKVFECVVKRDRNEDYTKYHVYDNVTLRNFITIIKDDDGYLVVSKYESGSTKYVNDPVRKEKVIGRIISNFFGTEFNCMVEDMPYKYGKQYPADSKKQRILTVQYQTNFFGMKGPRKMKAFMTEGKGFMNKALNEVYQKQKNLEKSKKKVLMFRNKAPRWSKEVGSYVLNFNGRASISSVKNFLMIGENQNELAVAKVLFGKFGKQLFNLDIRYPFNILQGIALAISSFDRKLACE